METKPIILAVLAVVAVAPPAHAGNDIAADVDGVYVRVGQRAPRVTGPAVLKQLNPFLAAAALPRATEDRRDDTPTVQVHVIYALPSDQPDRMLDTDGTIAGSVAGIQAWLRAQTGGRGLRIDTYHGEPDITFVRLSQPDAAYSATSTTYTGVMTELTQAFKDPRKAYLVFYDGTAPSGDPNFVICGQGTSVGSPGAVVMLREGCPYDLDLSRAGAAAVLELVALHELVHAMGFVPSCAPHVKWGHVADSPDDLMSPYLPLRAPILDLNHDDYFAADIAGCPDLQGSRFLEGGGKTLSVSVVDRGGTGSVSGSLGVVRCFSECVTTVDSWNTSSVELSVEVGPDSVFLGWGGACAGKALPCTVPLAGPQTVTARFGDATPPPQRLRVSVRGAGRVLSTPAGIECTKRCARLFPNGARVTLRAAPANGWRFDAWSGDCRGRAACRVGLTSPSSVRAVFAKA